MAESSTNNIIITLNVGGQLFQTTPQTLALAGSNSLLYTFSASTTTVFIDRDPDLFSILLSFLRTSRLPSKSLRFDLLDIIAEAEFYGIDPRSITGVSDSSRFDGFDLQKSKILPLNGRDSPSAISTTTASESVYVAHGNKITYFDWSLRRKSTLLTCFPEIDSLLGVSDSLVAAGATDFAGLRVFNVGKREVKATLTWKSNPLPGVGGNSTVQAIGSSPNHLFGSFESSRRNSNAIVAFDHTTLQPAVEFSRADEIYSSTETTANDLYSAIPSTKLQWLPSSNVLMASGSHGGPSGLVGNIKLWDIRSTNGGPIWHLKERDDCFSDVTVSDTLSTIFKVGINSGDVFMIDMRRLTNGGSKQDGTQWARIGEVWRSTGTSGKGREGSGCKMESYGNQVFCVKGENVEIWSEVAIASTVRDSGLAIEYGMVDGRVMRRNVMGKIKDGGCGRITKIGFGGNRMFLTRKDQQFVEVWESHVVLKL